MDPQLSMNRTHGTDRTNRTHLPNRTSSSSDTFVFIRGFGCDRSEVVDGRFPGKIPAIEHQTTC